MPHLKKYFLLFFLLVWSLPFSASAATLSFAPASGTIAVGDTLSVRVIVTSTDQAMNAVSGALAVSGGAFQIVSISKQGSILNFWAEDPSYSKTTAQFEGVALAGYQGSGGTVVNVGLRATAVGKGTLSFTNGSVLANDGNGTDIAKSLGTATITVVAAPTVVPNVPAAPKEATTTVPVIPPSEVATTTPVAPVAPSVPPAEPYQIFIEIFLVGAALIVLLWYGSRNLLTTHHRLAREGRTDDELLKKSFTLLKHDIRTHVTKLKRASAGRVLTTEEIAFLENFEAELDDAEKVITTESEPR